MIDKSALTIQKGLRVPSDSILVFQELNCFIYRMKSLIELIDTVLPVFDTTSTAKLIVDLRVGHNKSGSFVSFRFYDCYLLFFLGRKIQL